MIAVELRFPTGKLHATPWGRQVNEGAVEWPPSPWRIVRALVAVWRYKFPDLPPSVVESLVAALAPLPSFYLPSASQGHTRHYMPIANQGTTKVFDTFVAVPRDEAVLVCWPNVTLDEDQRTLLAKLLTAMNYFGRAESWVDAQLLNEWEGQFNAVPLDGRDIDASQQLERLLAPGPPTDYAQWREQFAKSNAKRLLEEKRRAADHKGKNPDSVKLSAADKRNLQAAVPRTWFDALHADTNELRKAGWNRPPGSCWVEYVRPANAFDSARSASSRRQNRTADRRPTVARYAVAGAVVPRLTNALRIGERARTFLMGCSKRVCEQDNAASVFSGKDSDGAPLSTPHQHAHFLSESTGRDGKITHLSVYAPMGFDEVDEQALARFKRTWGDDGHDLQFVLLGIGRVADFGGHNEKAGQSAIFAESDTWVSRTPLVLTRHLKLKSSERKDPLKRQSGLERELCQVVRLELDRRREFQSVAARVEIEALLGRNEAGTHLGGTFTPWLTFGRTRTKGSGQKAGHEGYGFRLRFPHPVSGPIALGYGCHFGLGQFIPAE
ncbi:MAG: type I-U CRISPR-associated protein Csb2 [Candidatus Paceibacterota bacterium]